MIYEYIAALVEYGIKTDLITPGDKIFVTNRYYELLGLSGDSLQCQALDMPLDVLLDTITAYAASRGLTEGNTAARERYEAKLMGVMIPFPHEVQRVFREKYRISPETATDWFYKLSLDSNYIRRGNMSRDVKWTAATDYGTLELTINLSKPEKDPLDIAAAGKQAGEGYPACLLCRENEGYAGRAGHPARQNLRIVPVKLAGQKWGLQYSPYVYYNEHCIVLSPMHSHMKIDRGTFNMLLDFVGQFPHYFVGSNADLPIVGGSILSHEHFQGGCHEMPMAKAPIETKLHFRGYENIHAGIVRWPMSVIRLKGENPSDLAQLADKILRVWRGYTDKNVQIFAFSDGEEHNTVTPIARGCGGGYELDLVLRNNRSTPDHPLGLFHPHEELHHIKKENIGLIEVMGLAILPGRLKADLDAIGEHIAGGQDIDDDPKLKIHAHWVKGFLPKYPEINSQNVRGILQKETAMVFLQALADAGVFKRDAAGQQAFMHFVDEVNKKDDA